MNRAVTVDARVFASAFTPSEKAHPASQAFMREVRRSRALQVFPFCGIISGKPAATC
jgi:hypothetical protein